MIFKSLFTHHSPPATLLVGLGNPGSKYASNRHNIGFMAIDRIAAAHSISKSQKKFSGELLEGAIDGQKLFLLKPLTYMNLSGESVAACARFYKIPPERIIVLHDELDLPPAKIRVKKGGGNGGHNGLKSIDAHLGKEYWRVRIGIGHPGDRNAVSNYVLSDFSKAEQPAMDAIASAIAAHIGVLLSGDEAGFMNKITLATQSNP